MNARTIYASIMTLFAVIIGFYAVMTLAFFFGETNKEWSFPLFITVSAILMIWTTVTLWRKKDALVLTAVCTAIVAGIGAWIFIPGQGSLDGAYLLLVATFLLALGMLVGLASSAIRKALLA